MSRALTRSVIVSLGLLAAANLQADVRLPALFSQHMVLQREAQVPVWGWAEPGEEVAVAIGGQTQTARADAQGKWMVKLSKLQAGGPQKLSVQGKNSLTIDDVLVGEVWLGSGQSNMGMTVSGAQNFEQEEKNADLPRVRMFTVTSGPAAAPQEDCKGQWVVCAPGTVGKFSATLFFFGRDLYKSLDVPVGLINSSVGGTPIESWISSDVQHASPELKAFFEAGAHEEKAFDPAAAKAKYEKDLACWKEVAKKAKKEGRPVPRAPRDPVALRKRKGNVGGLFNGKIAPLIPYAIRGAVWYQGEANTRGDKARFYQYQLPLLVTDWRARWGSEFPFAWVQLPNFTAGEGWCAVREAMLKSLKVPNTGMAVAIDIGEPKNIHPKNKQEVGRRLGMWALGTVYGKKIATSGPLPTAHTVRGHEMVVSFAHADGGLVAKRGNLKGFVIAGADHQWKPAQARIEGDVVVVSSPDVPQPVAVRYAWTDNPDCNLYNAAGLPASPFRTEDAK